jgi:hypothetical protein
MKKSGIRDLFFFWIPVFATMTLIFFTNPAHAEPTPYSPDYCDFSITFPEAPYIEEKCDGGFDKNECYKRISYTKVYDLDATIKIGVICNPVDEKLKNSYNQDVMVATLEEITKSRVVEKFESSFTEEEKYKIAGLVGEGKMGVTPTIFIAQLWIGEKSIFSIEAELTGDPHKNADALFRDILKSVQFKESAAPKDKKPEIVKKEDKTKPE